MHQLLKGLVQRWTTLIISGMLPLLAYAETYYVSGSFGDDSNPGTDVNQPFNSLSRAQAALADGDSLFLRSGDYWLLGSPVTINVSGTAQNPVVVGAYSVTANGQVTHSVDGSRPILDGGTTVPDRGSYQALVQIRGAYVHVRDIELTNSGGLGLEFSDTTDGVAENVKVDWSFHNGILSNRSDNVSISDCEVIGDSGGWKEFGSEFWGGGIAVARGTGFSVTNCLVREGYGEGISAFFGSRNISIDGNVIYAARAVGIYINASRDVEIRDNIILGTANPEFYRGKIGTTGPGISLDNEVYQFESYGGSVPLRAQTGSITIQNNLVAGTDVGIGFYEELPGATYDDIRVLHNTFVDNSVQLRGGSQRHEGSMIANNIFLSLSSGTEDFSAAENSDGIVWRSNYWSRGRPAQQMMGLGDLYDGLTLTKMSGWRDLHQYSDVTWSDFLPRSGASTIGAGSEGPSAGSSFDFNGVVFSNPPAIGALADGAAAARRPASPVILSVIR